METGKCLRIKVFIGVGDPLVFKNNTLAYTQTYNAGPNQGWERVLGT